MAELTDEQAFEIAKSCGVKCDYWDLKFSEAEINMRELLPLLQAAYDKGRKDQKEETEYRIW